MASETLTERAPNGPPAASTLDRYLSKPGAFVLTALVLLTLFGWTFVANPDRVAPTRDPAYYTWRTEALTSEDPGTLLDIEGAFGMFEGGYRVSAPVLGGYLRKVAGISELRTTVLLMVILPVLIPLLLAGFAYKQRRDPLLWHAVALGSGSLMLTPPFVGYLDNVLALTFLAASLHLIDATRDSWPARLGFGAMMLAVGFTHPTTLAFFGVTLGIMAAARFVLRGGDIRSVLRDDGPMLAAAFGAAVVTYLCWKVGIWGRSASLSEAALSPPYGSDFFLDRMILWIKAMRPVLNAPLFVLAVAGLLVVNGKRSAEDELTRTSILWLTPLVGIFGFLAGKAYPYYRFFNTTVAWILLIGIGMYLVMRFLMDASRSSGRSWLAAVGVVAMLAVVVANFTKGFDVSGWNNADGGWISASQRADLTELRTHLEDDAGRPVVFVIDDQPARDFQIWGFTKLSGNTARFGLPDGELEKGYLYLGSLENYLAGEPTLRDQETYDRLSPALLEDAEAGIAAAGAEPIVVVASAFNGGGVNAGIAIGEEPLPDDLGGATVWVLDDGRVTDWSSGSPEALPQAPKPEGSNLLHALLAALGLLVLLVPGYLAFRSLLPDEGLAGALGMVPALAMTILSLVGIAAIAVARTPFYGWLAWACVVASALLVYVLNPGSIGRRAA